MGASCTKINPPAGDPMQHYTLDGYVLMHQGVKEHTLDLKTAAGQAALHKLLPKTDVLLTSFRPSALSKLGLGWKALHKQYPALSLIEVVGAPGPLAEIPGHDLTYQAEVGLVNGMDLPPSLFADMGGAHAGYRMYACKNGRVAVAALEPHFAISLCAAAGIQLAQPVKDLFKPATRQAIEAFLASQTRAQLDKLAAAKDIPLMTLPR
jgi:crotonobetainyl-CoA:carnitine CoA-transferase CaiB-like acyl-CoA transferase